MTGLIVMTIRRIVEGNAAPDAPEQAVQRGLRALGVDEVESAELAAEAVVSVRTTLPGTSTE